ncbi:hypothetical protein [Candidatus Coxiella mudrowiae]|uniref:hypothetical protein n=1 Tax=Candidatus Coxiella mudrowiae TaxID=2054173 RepID=UPI0012FE84B7|nr:hypothetical protein [Candidatus Coxiella mudrowiae]
MEALHQLNQIIGHEQAMPSTDGLNIKYYPSSALNGNSGKIAEVGGVSPSVIIHALQLTVLFLAFNFNITEIKFPSTMRAFAAHDKSPFSIRLSQHLREGRKSPSDRPILPSVIILNLIFL